MNDAFFFQTQQITDHAILFNEFKQQKISFSTKLREISL